MHIAINKQIIISTLLYLRSKIETTNTNITIEKVAVREYDKTILIRRITVKMQYHIRFIIDIESSSFMQIMQDIAPAAIYIPYSWELIKKDDNSFP